MSEQTSHETAAPVGSAQTVKKEKKVTKMSITMLRRLALVTIFVNFLLIFVVGSATESAIAEKEVSYFGEILNNISSTVATSLEGYVGIADVVALNADIIEMLENTSSAVPMQSQENVNAVLQFTSGVEKQFDAILNVGVCSITQDAYLLHDGSISGSNWSFANRSYYSVTQTKQSMITDPYIDDATGELIVTMASPIISTNGTVVGGVFVDLSMDFVVNLVGTSGFGETGKTLIADNYGNLVACMDYDFIGTSYKNLGDSGPELESEMANPTGKVIDLIAGGNPAYGKVASVAGTNWVVVTNVQVSEFDSAFDHVQTILLTMLIFSITATLIVAAWTVQQAIKPIEYLRVAMGELSMGNTQYKFDYESKNEIGALADDLRFTTNNLHHYIIEIDRQLDQCSRGDFIIQSEMEFLGDFAAIQVSIGNFTTLISNALNNMKATVGEVSVGSDYVATGSQSLAEGSSKQSISVSALNENIADVSKTISENVKNVKHVNTCSRQAAEELKKNNSKMNEMVDSMNEINRTSEGIQKIVKTIEDVAFQTNILALNAAVEATRAGTAGRGFAVVAEEVRNLSSRTSAAVQETTRLIEETVSAVKTGTNIVDETAKGLEDVIEFVGSFMGALTEITEASQQQANAIEEIQQGVADINSVMQQNSAISEESAATSEELSSQATVMKETIEQFKTRPNN
ncbi:MAG: methyl-accepting chemotaxis protein [Eubacteriales bacterium]